MIYDEPLLWEKGNAESIGFSIPKSVDVEYNAESKYKRDELNLPGFSEPVVARHFTRLSTWNYGVDTDIYPLGSCTMKYNPKTNERQASLSGFTKSHPLCGDEYSQGCLEIIYKTGEFLKEITAMDDVTLQPAAGAHGELVGMLMFNSYHKSRGDDRSVVLIPDSAHGTNPASAALCGFKTKIVKSNEHGIITGDSIRELMDDSVAGIMITNPNTLGLFETNIKEICDIIHQGGGLVYADGANLNAIMGIVQMGKAGVDVMHLNLHKTFSTPHGGGGPGAGPVCVNKKLSPFLPKPRVIKKNNKYILEENFPNSIGRVHGFNGNFSVVIKAYSYILSLGAEGLRSVSHHAVLNANYIKVKLKDFYNVPYKGDVMHEVLLNDKNQSDITTMDIAKRLIDMGIHPPTIYFPLVVTGAMLIEPTENESLSSLDNFIEKMIKISKESSSKPEILIQSPLKVKRKRINETQAARKPILRGDISG